MVRSPQPRLTAQPEGLHVFHHAAILTPSAVMARIKWRSRRHRRKRRNLIHMPTTPHLHMPTTSHCLLIRLIMRLYGQIETRSIRSPWLMILSLFISTFRLDLYDIDIVTSDWHSNLSIRLPPWPASMHYYDILHFPPASRGSGCTFQQILLYWSPWLRFNISECLNEAVLFSDCWDTTLWFPQKIGCNFSNTFAEFADS